MDGCAAGRSYSDIGLFGAGRGRAVFDVMFVRMIDVIGGKGLLVGPQLL